jgi:DNA transformation protein
VAAQSEFVDYLVELLEPLGSIHAKPMFGGFGIFRHDLMFGLVSEDTLYLKVDDNNRPDFEVRGLAPFTYRHKDKQVAMSYYQAPNEIMDDAEELCGRAFRGTFLRLTITW